MRLLSVFYVIGMTALAPAAEAQVPEFPPRPLLDVPADYQALKPLATDWPRPSEALDFYRTRFNMGATGPSNLRNVSEVLRLRDSGRIATPAGAPVDGAAPVPAESSTTDAAESSP